MRALLPQLVRFNFNYDNRPLGVFSWIKSLSTMWILLWILVVSLVIALVIRYISHHFELLLLVNQIEATQGTIRENRSKVEASSDKIADNLTHSHFKEVLKDLERNSQDMVDILFEVSHRIPQFAWITMLHQSKGALSIQGIAIDPLTVATFAQALSNSILISRLEIKGVKQIERSGVYLQEFSLEAMLR